MRSQEQVHVPAVGFVCRTSIEQYSTLSKNAEKYEFVVQLHSVGKYWLYNLQCKALLSKNFYKKIVVQMQSKE